MLGSLYPWGAWPGRSMAVTMRPLPSNNHDRLKAVLIVMGQAGLRALPSQGNNRSCWPP